MIFSSVKPGDVLALRMRGVACILSAPVKVTIAKVTATTMTDTRGKRWRRSDGKAIGGSEHVEPWGARHDAQSKLVRARLLAFAVDKAIDDATPERVLEALPHIEAAAAALGVE